MNHGLVLILTGLFLLALAKPGNAIVISDGDGTGNLGSPTDDPGFGNVGLRGAGSAIYLGNRWVLTASHVGAGPTVLGDIEFAHIVESTARVQNPGKGLSPATDIVLYQLQEDPGLPALHLPCQSVELGAQVLMVGAGRDRVEELSFWEVDRSPGPSDDVWVAVGAEANPDESGYLTTSSRSIRWGANVVSLVNQEIDIGLGDVLSFQTTFDDRFPILSEGQAVTGDSGGGIFVKYGEIWTLSGMIHAVQTKENQPGAADTALLGSATFAADVFKYADELRMLADFEPAPGDYNGDGLFTASDINLLQSSIRHGESSTCHFDSNQDNAISGLDLDEWLRQNQTLIGDADLDGRVAFPDFLQLSDNFARQGGWGQGDFTGDGFVDFADFLLLSDQFGNAFDGEVVTFAVAAVPEPVGVGFSLFAIFAISLLRNSRRF